MKTSGRSLPIWVLLALMVGLLCGAREASAQSAATVDFNDFPLRTFVTNQYLARGLPVQFHDNQIADTEISGGAHVLFNKEVGTEFDPGPIRIDFIAPQHLVNLSGSFSGLGTQQATLSAFDANGTLIGRDGPRTVTGNVMNTTFTVATGTNVIAAVEFFVDSGVANEVIDDLHFEGEGMPAGPVSFPKSAPPSVGGKTPDTGTSVSVPDGITETRSAIEIQITTGSGTASGGGGGGTASADPQGAMTCTGSHVDNLRWSYVHTAVDFSLTGKLGSECPCGTCKPRGAGALPGELARLEVNRIHRPLHAFVVPSSFGPGVFSEFDTNLTFVNPTDGTPATVLLYDVDTDSGPLAFRAGPGNLYFDDLRLYKSLKVLDASGNVVMSSSSAAVKAILTSQTGESWTFEVINPSAGSSNRAGRLVRKDDRNGNGELVTYAFGPDSSDAALGFDRTKLWQIASFADPYGAAATVTYGNFGGRWVVTSVTVPNGATGADATIRYDYNSGASLAQVTYPDGGVSTFVTSVDAAAQETVLTFQDAGAPAVGANKQVRLTQSSIVTPGGTVSQQPNLVRRVVNGVGELVYRNWEDPSDANVLYTFEAPQKLTRVTSSSGYPVRVDLAQSAFDPGTGDPTTATYDVVESYQVSQDFMMSGRSRPDGAGKTFTRDSLSRAVTSVTFPGGGKVTAAYNAFRSPTSIVDLKGNTHSFTYDPKGNLTQSTIASGTGAQATYRRTYNGRGQPLTETDPRGNVVSYSYDTRGLLTQITQPPDVAGGTAPKISYSYDASGRLVGETDASGHQSRYSYDLRGRLVTITHPDLTTEHYAFAANLNVPVTISDRNGNVTAMQYDGAGRVTSITRASGRPEAVISTRSYLPGTSLLASETGAGDQISYAYDQRRRLVGTSRVNAFGSTRTTTTIWDVFDRKLADTDDQGRNTFYVYDNNDRVIRVIRELVAQPGRFSPANLPGTRDREGNPTYVIEDLTYDVNGLVSSKVDVLGTTETRRYDALGRVVEIVRAAGTPSASKQQMVYDAAGNNTKIIEPRTFTEGNGVDSFRQEMTYTGRNLLATRTQAVGRPEATVAQRLTYTLTGKVATRADANGNVSVLKYDVNDRLAEEDDAAGFATKYSYDGNGNKTSVTDPLGHTTTYAFDGLGRPTRTTRPAGEIETVEYDDDLTDGVGIDATGITADLDFVAGSADGSAVKTTSPTGVVLISVRDALSRVVREQRGTGTDARRVTTNRDLATAVTANRPYTLAQTQITDPLGNVTLFNRDGNDAIIEVVDAEGKTTTAVVNAKGQSLSERDAVNVGFDCSYDALGRQTSCKDSQGATTSKTYDVADNVVTETNGLGRVKTTRFDGRNLPVEVNESNQTTKYQYDGLAHVVQMLDTESKTTTYRYDNRGLRTAVIYSDGRTFSTSYDAARRVSSTVDQLSQTTSFTYDADDRLTARRYPDSLNDTFSYDADSRLTLAHSSRYNNDVRRAYDAQNRVTRETVTVDGKDYVTQRAYNPADRVTQVTYPNGSVLLKNYNKRHELTELTFDGALVASSTRDDAGRATLTTLGNGLKETRTFRNDDLLASLKLSNPSGAALAGLTYAFDAAKRKTQELNTLNNNETQNFTYDTLDRLTKFSQGSNSQSWTLSPAGNWQNTTRNGVTENRAHGSAYEVTGITTNTTVNLGNDVRGNVTKDEAGSVYTWDFDNQLQKTVSSAGVTTAYGYDALGRRLWRSVGSSKTVFVNEGDRQTAHVLAEYVNGSFQRSYVHGEYFDQVVMMVVGSARYFFTVNEQFSPIAVSDAAGTVVERYRYDAYGQRTVFSASGATLPASSIGNRVGFTGRVHEDNGLVYFRTRYYRPFLGRFVSRDAEFFDGPNLYAAYFVPNSLDPSGQWGFKSIVQGIKKAAQKVAVSVEAAVKNADPFFAFIAEIKIEGTGTLSFCTGNLVLEGKIYWTVGAQASAFGATAFAGIKGDKSLGRTQFHPFNGFGCRADCDRCCQPTNATTVSAKSTGFFSALQSLEEKLGFEVTVDIKYDGCALEVGVGLKANLLPLIPVVGEVAILVNETKFGKVEAGVIGGASLRQCKTKNGTMDFEDGLVMLGLYAKIGVQSSK